MKTERKVNFNRVFWITLTSLTAGAIGGLITSFTYGDIGLGLGLMGGVIIALPVVLGAWVAQAYLGMK